MAVPLLGGKVLLEEDRSRPAWEVGASLAWGEPSADQLHAQTARAVWWWRLHQADLADQEASACREMQVGAVRRTLVQHLEALGAPVDLAHRRTQEAQVGRRLAQPAWELLGEEQRLRMVSEQHAWQAWEVGRLARGTSEQLQAQRAARAWAQCLQKPGSQHLAE